MCKDIEDYVSEVDPCSGAVVQADYFVKPMKWDSYWAVIDDPFNKPTQDNLVYLQYNDGANDILEFYPTSLTYNSWALTYLKLPIDIDGTNNPGLEPELPEHTHEEIVNIAVRKMMLNIESQSYQGHAGETSIME